LAIQAITPSAHNLASSRLLRILFETAALTETDPARGEATTTSGRVSQNESAPRRSPPPIDKHRKKTPGVLCLLVRAGSQAGPRRHALNSLRIEFMPDSPWESLIKSAQIGTHPIPFLAEQATDILHALCRLTC
jgi:hypothetical protein